MNDELAYSRSSAEKVCHSLWKLLLPCRMIGTNDMSLFGVTKVISTLGHSVLFYIDFRRDR
jgi:hypothetical protein